MHDETDDIILTPDILLRAYAAGLFPMAKGRGAKGLAWYDPDRRGILPLKGFHVPRRLVRRMRKGGYRVTFDKAFDRVIRACADARAETWINDEIINLYTETHAAGFAHSAEIWMAGTAGRWELSGGVYGIALGGAFFGESMFSTRTDASKLALVHLAARLHARGFTLFDAQFVNDHLLQFGCIEIPRAAYRRQLTAALGLSVSFGGDDYSAALSDGPDVSTLSAGAASSVKAAEAEVLSFLQAMTQTS